MPETKTEEALLWHVIMAQGPEQTVDRSISVTYLDQGWFEVLLTEMSKNATFATMISSATQKKFMACVVEDPHSEYEPRTHLRVYWEHDGEPRRGGFPYLP